MKHDSISIASRLSFLLCFFLLIFVPPAYSEESSGKESKENVISDSFVEKIASLEGMTTNSRETSQLAQALFAAIGDPKSGIEPWELFDGARSTTDKRIKDILFVYGLMLLALEDLGVDAFEKLQEYQPQLTYMDELPADSDGVLAFGYAWLINNTEVTVPCWFIREHPEVFDHHTPFWGATRDAYFSVCIPESWNPESLPAYEELLSALEDAYNPGSCSLGSIVNVRYKSIASEIALIANRPDYYLQNTRWNDRSNWLDYWKYLGPYNYRVAERIQKAVEFTKSALVEMLSTPVTRNKQTAEAMASLYLNNLVANKIGWSYEPYATVLEEYTQYGLTQWDTPPDRYYAAEILGGFLLHNRSVEEFIAYVHWLREHGRMKAIYTLMNFAAADNTAALQRMLELHLPIPEQWGAFNKSPLMYAVQYNNHASYELLKGLVPMDTVTVADKDGWRDCEIPKISHRTVLTYAAENVDIELLLQVIHDFGAKYGAAVDSDGRGFEDYLAKNTQFSEKEKARMRSTLALTAKMATQGGE